MKARLIAFYLPQFHPIKENDEWWGKGFTEWTNVGKAKPLFRGHYQPKVPADLGYYDLRVPETRIAQAQMAKECGIEGFCYWHYWFGNGKRLLERPFNEVLQSGKPDFPFCLAWANETWKGFDHGLINRNVLIEQSYPGIEDYTAHFFELLPAFKDKRYITVDGKPLFMIYKPLNFQDIGNFMQLWRKLACENGLKGIYFVGQTGTIAHKEMIISLGMDAVNLVSLGDMWKGKSYLERIKSGIQRYVFHYPVICKYNTITKYFAIDRNTELNLFPTLFPNWDHTPRSGNHGMVCTNSNPTQFEKHCREVLASVGLKKEEQNLIFVKSWNEWAEGNYLEPDLKYGHGFLNAIKNALNDLS